MCLVVYPSGVGFGEGTHLSIKLVLLFDDQLDWPISLPSHLGIRVELMIESEGLFDEDSAFDKDLITAMCAPVSNTTSHPQGVQSHLRRIGEDCHEFYLLGVSNPHLSHQLQK